MLVLSRIYQLSDRLSRRIHPTTLEVGISTQILLNNSTRCLAIQFNSQVVHVLGGIEGLLEDMSSNTKVNKDVNKQ